MDWLDLLAVQGTLKSLLQHHSSKASITLIFLLNRPSIPEVNPTWLSCLILFKHSWIQFANILLMTLHVDLCFIHSFLFCNVFNRVLLLGQCWPSSNELENLPCAFIV